MSDIWERFGFYGLQATLVLFASAPVAEGGLGLAPVDATALFGAWIGVAFMLSLPGGWAADRLFGARRALPAGALTLAAGYLLLAVPGAALPGLLVIAAGTGLYKPNHQAMVNALLGDRGRREAGISVLYIATQASALLAPLVIGYLGERIDWRLGFGTASAVMLGCAVQLLVAKPLFREIGEVPGRPIGARGRRLAFRYFAPAACVVTAVIVAATTAGWLTAGRAVMMVGVLSVAFPVIAFTVLYRNPKLDRAARRRLRTFLWVFLGSTLFWLLVAQDGSVLALFGRDSTDRALGGVTIPASWLQACTPLFILLVAPVSAWLLPKTGRGAHAVPVKFATGLAMAGTSFVIMAFAAEKATTGPVSPLWLMIVFLLHACGELVISAVGIAAIAELLPAGFLSHALGMWWLFAALGGGLGSQLVRLTAVVPLSGYFAAFGVITCAVAAVMFLVRDKIRRGLAETAAAGPDEPALVDH